MTRVSADLLVTERAKFAHCRRYSLGSIHASVSEAAEVLETMNIKPKSWMEIRDMGRDNPHLKDLRPWLSLLTECCDEWPGVTELNRLLCLQLPQSPWTFIKQEKPPRRSKSKGMASLSGYLELVLKHHKVPVREFSLHDLLNALTYTMFPKSKRALAERHQSESPQGITPGLNRTRTQDLLTIFDEGGVIRLYSADQQHRDIVFGHAVYEHMINGIGLRAARLDFYGCDQIIGSSIQEATGLADRLLSEWLGSRGRCLAAHEFSSVQIPPIPMTSCR